MALYDIVITYDYIFYFAMAIVPLIFVSHYAKNIEQLYRELFQNFSIFSRGNRNR